MNFSSWLFEQADLPGEVGRLAKLCWTDVNNGCGNPRFTAREWTEHFAVRHADKKVILGELVVKAHLELIKELKNERPGPRKN